jgi:predicted NBD/HSP70 family sugar kinase
MERLRILAACAALKVFTVPELVVYSGANENTVRSVLQREAGLFERLDEPRTVGTPGPREMGRPAVIWRVSDPQRIRRLLSDLQSELSGIEREAATAPQEREESAYVNHMTAIKVAEDAVLRALEEPNPELRRVLSEAALNDLRDVPQVVPAQDKLNDADRWNSGYGDNMEMVSSEQRLWRRVEAVAFLARILDTEARDAAMNDEQPAEQESDSLIGAEHLARAAVAVSQLTIEPPQQQVQAFFQRLADMAMARRLPVGSETVFGTIVAAKSPVSVSDVGVRTGLPEHEVQRALKPLLRRGYVVPQHEEDSPHSERPTPPVRVNEDQYRAIGISVLPEKVIGVLTNLRALDSTVKHRDFGAHRGPVTVSALVRAVDSLVKEFRGVRSDIIGLGIELPGHVNGEMGEVIFSPVLTERNVPLKEELEHAIGLPTVVENDANALAVHEQWFGDGANIRDFAVVLLSEYGGIGSGIVANGQLVYGRKGAAGELGHIEFEPEGRECYCGKLGCLETVAGVGGIRRAIEEMGYQLDSLANAAELVETDKAVEEILLRAGRALGWGIAAVLNLLDPERVILFGPPQLVEPERYPAAKLLMKAVENTSRKRAFSTAAEYKQVWRPLPHEPVLPYEQLWRPLPEEGAIAASAVLGRFIRRPLDWASKGMN